MYANDEEIGKFKMGVVVKCLINETRYGHVTGFDLNVSGEVIVKVAVADGKEVLVHPANLEVL